MISLPDGWRLVLATLAAFRLTWEIVYGPYLQWLRMWAGVYDYGPNGEAQTALGRWLGCPYCVSVLSSVLVSSAILFPTSVGDIILTLFGLAGAMALLIRWRTWQ